MKRFVIGTDITTAEQDAAFHKALIDRWPDLSWWHQLDEMWLIVDGTDELTAAKLRNTVTKALPGINVMIIEVPHGGTWAGFGPSKGTKSDMFTWMTEVWDRRP
jgi:hypothetical protein